MMINLLIIFFSLSFAYNFFKAALNSASCYTVKLYKQGGCLATMMLTGPVNSKCKKYYVVLSDAITVLSPEVTFEIINDFSMEYVCMLVIGHNNELQINDVNAFISNMCYKQI
ncbi:uncharacterized protein EV154DRAFT_485924 [Mucor mucedo]|uniref:uncharacterized protein n=1 Tax=Mucor mucedo TaxID=29922 RepID=UPI002220732B|nr:uncharacterized protein EV154DRAFT_485924 [Mucor mucedo]KAI7880506.1 hypothetical protein EV154DRAFT_485924 [Mucor mucedo]